MKTAMTSGQHLTPRLALRPMTQHLAAPLGEAIAAIEPWSVIDYPASALTAFLSAADPALSRHAIIVDDELAGVIAVRKPWLHGPYLQLLALLPPFQGQGLGVALLNWFESQAHPGNRWAWLCYSRFNPRAGAFYTRQGFHEVASLPDLMADGLEEVLMRKRINLAV